MARAALIISGEMRRAYNCAQTAKNLSQICDVDVFLHTWNQITYSARQKDLKLNIREDNLTHESLISEIEPKAHLVESKDALDHIIDEVKEYSDIDKESEKGKLWNKEIADRIKYTNHTCLSQFYSHRKSYDIFKEYRGKNNIKYDFVIKTRSDILITPKPGGVNLILESLCVFDKDPDNNPEISENHASKNIKLIRCPWVYSTHRGEVIMEYALMTGRPDAFDLLYEDFPYSLPKIKDNGDGNSHTSFFEHLRSKKIYLRCTVPFFYDLDHNPLEMAK